ncbi:hypothetical protein ISN75_21175 [Dyella marensis]|uniref:hypothetical protein n=1 Tax=Dyella marensis TaxID=500610 RepID=UPI0031CEC720
MQKLSGSGRFFGQRVSQGPAVIGGTCRLQGAISPNTGLPLTQHAAVKLGASGFAIPNWDVPEVHFLYSWKCCISQGDLSYRYASGRLEIIEYTAGTEDFAGFPYDGYPVVFPAAQFLLRPIPEEDQEIIARLNNTELDQGFKFENARAGQLSIPTHQFGGVPFLLNPLMEEKRCVACGDEMVLIASIGNNSFSHDGGFFGNDFVQLVFFGCDRCKVLSAVNVAS